MLQLANQGIESRGTAKRLQQLCRENNLPVAVQEKKISEGWMDKVKGML
jgi:hypothetical protein